MGSFDEMRLETSSPFRAVPKGSDVFQKAMVQLYTDMQAEKEKRRLRKEQAGTIDEEDDFSDEERDKCTDIKKFRRFSQDFSAKQHHFKRTASLHHVLPAPNSPNFTSPRLSPRMSKVAEIRSKMDKTQSPIHRRHSIATFSPVDHENKR